METVSETVEVVVIGGGPGGSTVASLLAREGVDVLVLEKEHFPRFHIGESMLPQSAKVWRRLGVMDKLAERYMHKHGARFVCGLTGREQTYYFREAFDTDAALAFQVPRADFDDLLLREAESHGARVRHGWEVREPVMDAGGTVVGVRVQDPSGTLREVRARIVVDATGRDTLMATRGGMKRKLPGLDKTALFAHFDGVTRRCGPDEGHIDVVTWEHGWFWSIPFKDGTNSVGAVCSSAFLRERVSGEPLERLFARAVAQTPGMARLLEGARRLVPVRAISDYSYRVDRLAGNGWVMVGDGGGFIDPLFSSGAHVAFTSGALAADEILVGLRDGRGFGAERWVGYERRVRYGAEVFVGAVQSFYAGPLRERIFEGEQREVLRRTITSMLAGDVFDEGAPYLSFVRRHFPARVTA